MVKTAAISCLAILLSGCAGTVSFKVPEADKDPAFSYDGRYAVSVDSRGGKQEMGSGWFIECSAQAFNDEFSVQSSEVSWALGDSTAKGFVNSAGQFRLEQPMDGEVGGFGTTMSDGSVTLILQGNVDDETMKGLLTFGVAQFNNRGCAYPMRFNTI